MKQYLKTYNDKYALWTQLYGCIGLFGSFIVFIVERPAYDGWPIISIVMFFSGMIICGFNKAIDDMDFKEIHAKEEQELLDKINRGELPPERYSMWKKMFK